MSSDEKVTIEITKNQAEFLSAALNVYAQKFYDIANSKDLAFAAGAQDWSAETREIWFKHSRDMDELRDLVRRQAKILVPS